MSIFPSFPLLPFFNFPPRWWFTRKSRGSIRNGNRRWLPEPRPRSVKLAAADSYLLPRSGVLHCEIDSFITEGRREREREKRIARLCIPFQRAKIAYHWKKRLASLSPRAICSQHETAPRHVFFFFNLNYSRVNVNCDRVEGECIGRKRDPWNGSILIWAIATLQVPRLRLFQGISEFSMHNRTVVERERRYTQRSKKMANDWRGKRTQLETQLLWHILVENVAT